MKKQPYFIEDPGSTPLKPDKEPPDKPPLYVKNYVLFSEAFFSKDTMTDQILRITGRCLATFADIFGKEINPGIGMTKETVKQILRIGRVSPCYG